MNTVNVRNITLGEGKPKICAPLIGENTEDLLRGLCEMKRYPFDILEWRGDFFSQAADCDEVLEMLGRLRAELGEMPIIFTFRTRSQGGNDITFTGEQYKGLLMAVAKSGMADLIDIELAAGSAEEIIESAEDAKIILSHHDFEKTPSAEEIIRKFEEMLAYPAVVSKLALTPRCRQDVINLMSAVVHMGETHPERLMVAISMGAQGLITRIGAEFIGSVMTFGAAGKASAPGQIGTAELKTALDIMHA